MRQSALERARDGHGLGTAERAGGTRRLANAWKIWWTGRGLNPRHQDFQFSSRTAIRATGETLEGHTQPRGWQPWTGAAGGASCARSDIAANPVCAQVSVNRCLERRGVGRYSGTVWTAGPDACTAVEDGAGSPPRAAVAARRETAE